MCQTARVLAAVWDRVEASGWELLRIEQSGTHATTWLREPGTKNEWLHKDTTIPSNGVEQGEDWSEVISTQVAILLGVPCAPTQLCHRNGRRGTLSRSILLKAHDLHEGATVLQAAKAPGFFPHVEGEPAASDPARPGIKRPGHSLDNIKQVLFGSAPPPGFSGPSEMTGYDVFAGYMVLDALIANPDRHEHNWAKLVPRLANEPEHLAPSYDHASSLGHNLTPDRARSLQSPDDRVETWAGKGLAKRFENAGQPSTLVEHARTAIEMCTPVGAHWWGRQLHALDLAPVIEPITNGAIPEMSEVTSMFASKVLNINLRRLRDAIGHHP